MVTEDAPAGAGQRTCGTHNVSCSRCIPVWTAGQASTAAVLLWAIMLHYKAQVLPYQLIQQKARSCQHRSPVQNVRDPPRPILLLQGARSAAWAATILSRRQQKHMTRRR